MLLAKPQVFFPIGVYLEVVLLSAYIKLSWSSQNWMPDGTGDTYRVLIHSKTGLLFYNY